MRMVTALSTIVVVLSILLHQSCAHKKCAKPVLCYELVAPISPFFQKVSFVLRIRSTIFVNLALRIRSTIFANLAFFPESEFCATNLLCQSRPFSMNTSFAPFVHVGAMCDRYSMVKISLGSGKCIGLRRTSYLVVLSLLISLEPEGANSRSIRNPS